MMGGGGAQGSLLAALQVGSKAGLCATSRLRSIDSRARLSWTLLDSVVVMVLCIILLFAVCAGTGFAWKYC